MKSIFNNSIIDNIVLWVLPLLSIWLLPNLYNPSNFFYLLILLFFLYIFDSGHVYLTYIRVFKEFKKDKFFFIITPILVFVFLYYIAKFNNSMFFYVIGYLTIFHFVRQIYGINRWYLKLENEKITQLRDHVIYIITLIPLLILFFRNPIDTKEYGYQFFTFKTSCNECIIDALNILFLVAIFSFLVQEYLFFKKSKKINVNRILFVIGTGLVFWWIGNFAKTPLDIIIPLVVMHGGTYFAVTIKFEKDFYKYSLKKAVIIALIVGITFGIIINTLYEKDIFYENHILLALLFTPLVTHYVIDMRIWLNSYIQKLNQ